MLGISWIAENLIPSQKGICSVEFVISIGTPNNVLWSPRVPRSPVWETLLYMNCIIQVILVLCYAHRSSKSTDVSQPNYLSWRHRNGLTPVTEIVLHCSCSPLHRAVSALHSPRENNQYENHPQPQHEMSVLHTHTHKSDGTLSVRHEALLCKTDTSPPRGTLYREWYCKNRK
jgi:hypothetical protein